MVFTQKEVKSRKNIILIGLTVVLFGLSIYLLVSRLGQTTNPSAALLADVAMQQTVSPTATGDWSSAKLDYNLLKDWDLASFKQYFTPIEVDKLSRGRSEVFSPAPAQ